MESLEWLDYGLKFLAVLALLLLTLWAVGRVSASRGLRGGARLQVLETLSLGPRQRLVLLRVEDKLLLVGVSPAGLVRLESLPLSAQEGAEPVAASASTLTQQTEPLPASTGEFIRPNRFYDLVSAHLHPGRKPQ